MSNNHKNSFCPFAEQLVSFLYGETDQTETRDFTAHLANCAACAEELKSFGFVRAAVSQWRDAEFAELPTPIFSIPEYHSKTPSTVVSDSIFNKNRSRLHAFYQLFQFNQLTAAAAFAVIVVCAGLFWLTFDFKGGVETAENAAVKSIAQVAVSPSAEIVRKPETIDAAQSNDEKSAPKFPETKSKPETSAGKTAGKISSGALQNNRGNAVRKPEYINTINKKPAVVKKPAIPSLNDAEDEIDETIRLADLFAELDAE